MEKDSTLLYWLWLAEVLGPANQNLRKVLEFGTIEEIYTNRIAAYSAGVFTEKQFAAATAYGLDDAARRLAECEKAGIEVVHCAAYGYPPELWHLAAPPVVLYVKGSTHVLRSGHKVAMVGSRRPSAYGAEAAKLIGEGLAKAGVTIVSGLAAGLDSEGHKAAIRQGAPTIGVVAGGADTVYPAASRELYRMVEKYGAIVSEYPPSEKPFAAAFLQRNRIIAALCSAVVVLEARSRSGTISTANHALDIGRQVFSVPGSIFSPLSAGTNALLKEGAAPATCPEDILAFLGLAVPVTEEQQAQQVLQLSPAAAEMKNRLTTTPKSLALLCEETKFAPGAALAALSELEMLGEARRLPGQVYTLAV